MLVYFYPRIASDSRPPWWQKEEAPLLPSFSEDEQAYQKRAWENLIGVLLDSGAARHAPRARHAHATRTPPARHPHATRTPLPLTGASDAQDAPSRATWEPPSSTKASPWA